VVVAAALLGMGRLALLLGRWREVSRHMLTVGRGIVCARSAALAVEALTMALDEAPGAVAGMLAAELFTRGRIVT